jgi:hypothetical protein
MAAKRKLRHCSMADMTFNWPRLKCPRSRCRHVGPWARKISATSRAGRCTRDYGAGVGPGSNGPITWRRISVATWVYKAVVSSLWPAGHKLESTVRYLGIEVDDALEMAEQTEV